MKNREDALRAIAEAEAKIAEAKAILKQKEEEIVLEYSINCYYIGAYQVTAGFGYTPEVLKHARYRNTEEQAEQALQREKEANRLEARVLEIEPNWKADWKDTDQGKWSMHYNYSIKKYQKWRNLEIRDIGVIYMSEKTATQILEELNSGRYKL